MNTMEKIINKLMMAKKMSAIYTDCDNSDTFHVGIILMKASGWIMEYNIGTHGEYDGYSAEPIDGIYRLETESSYLERLEKLSRGKGVKIKINTEGDDPIICLLRHAKENKKVVCIAVKEDGNALTGFIDKYDDQVVFMTQLDDMGRIDGKTVFYKNDIKRMNCDDVDCRDIEHLASM